MRRIVEGHPGHDTMFYNVMRSAMAAGITSKTSWRSERLLQARAVKAARYCDSIFAVAITR